jgi:hypothetical protein
MTLAYLGGICIFLGGVGVGVMLGIEFGQRKVHLP